MLVVVLRCVLTNLVRSLRYGAGRGARKPVTGSGYRVLGSVPLGKKRKPLRWLEAIRENA